MIKFPQAGFTLLEMAAAIAIMTILLPFILVPFANMLLKGASSSAVDQSAFLAERKIEEMMGTRFTQLTDVPTQSFSAPYNGYQFSVNVDYVQDSRNLNAVVVGPTNYQRARIVVISPQGNPYAVNLLFTQ